MPAPHLLDLATPRLCRYPQVLSFFRLFFFSCQVSPQIVPFSFGDDPANSGESVSTVCTVSRGDNPLEFSWFFNGDKLLLDDREGFSISTSKRRSLLEIEAVSADHAGEYTCSVSNEAGATSFSNTLVVNGKSSHESHSSKKNRVLKTHSFYCSREVLSSSHHSHTRITSVIITITAIFFFT